MAQTLLAYSLEEQARADMASKDAMITKMRDQISALETECDVSTREQHRRHDTALALLRSEYEVSTAAAVAKAVEAAHEDADERVQLAVTAAEQVAAEELGVEKARSLEAVAALERAAKEEMAVAEARLAATLEEATSRSEALSADAAALARAHAQKEAEHVEEECAVMSAALETAEAERKSLEEQARADMASKDAKQIELDRAREKLGGLQREVRLWCC